MIAPNPTQAPRLPEPLARRNCGYIARGADGDYWLWTYVWGHHNGEPPTMLGRNRAEVSRNLQGIQFSVPIYLEDAE